MQKKEKNNEPERLQPNSPGKRPGRKITKNYPACKAPNFSPGQRHRRLIGLNQPACKAGTATQHLKDVSLTD